MKILSGLLLYAGLASIVVGVALSIAGTIELWDTPITMKLKFAYCWKPLLAYLVGYGLVLLSWRVEK